MRCPSCGHDLPAVARFCNWCGAPITPTETDVGGGVSIIEPEPGGDWDAKGNAPGRRLALAAFALVVVVVALVAKAALAPEQDVALPTAPRDLAPSELGSEGDLASVSTVLPTCATIAGRGGVVPGAPYLCTRWAFDSDADELSAPAVSGGLVWVSGRQLIDAEQAGAGFLSGLDRDDGSVRQRGDLPGGPTVVAGAGGGAVVLALSGPEGATLVHHTADGARDLGALPARASQPPIVVAGVVVVAAGDEVVAVDEATGEQLWVIADGRISSLMVADGVVFVGARGGEVVAHALDSGEELWRVEVAGAAYVATDLTDRALIVGGGDGGLYSFDAQSGQQRWHRPTGVFARIRPAVADDTVFAVDPSGNLRAFDADTGDETLRAPLGALAAATPVIADDVVYLRTSVGGIVGVSAETGASLLRWYPEDSSGRAVPVYDGETLYVSVGGTLHALDRTFRTD